MTITEITHTFRRRYRELGYLVCSAHSIRRSTGYDEVRFLTLQCKWVASIYLQPDGITYDAYNYHLDHPHSLYDYNDPQLIDQLDQLIADSHNGISK